MVEKYGNPIFTEFRCKTYYGTQVYDLVLHIYNDAVMFLVPFSLSSPVVWSANFSPAIASRSAEVYASSTRNILCTLESQRFLEMSWQSGNVVEL